MVVVRAENIFQPYFEIGILLMKKKRYEEKIEVQMQLSRLYDEWMISVTKGDLEASDRLWQDMGVVYQNLRNYISSIQA